MPSALSYPGVYIEEVSSGVHAIVGVATSIAAFVGRAQRGPIDRAIHVTDRASFARTFGGLLDKNELWVSFNQFFDNGGTDCYVVRVAHGAVDADVTLRNVDGADVLVVSAKDKGAWGNGYRLQVDYNTSNPDDTFNLRVLRDEGDNVASLVEEHTGLSMTPGVGRYAPDFVSDSSDTIKLALAAAAPPANDAGFSEGRRPIDPGAGTFAAALNAIVTGAAHRFEISVDDGPFVNVDLAFGGAFANGQAAIATDIKGRIEHFLPPGVTVDASFPVLDGNVRVLRIASGTADKTSVRIRPSRSEDAAGALMLGVSQGGIEATRYRTLRPAPTATVFKGDVNDLAKLQQSVVTAITVDGAAIPLIESGTPILQTTAAGDAWYRDNAGPLSPSQNNDGIREKLRILAGAISRYTPAGGTRTFRAEVWGYHLAIVPLDGAPSRTMAAASGTDIAAAAFAEGPRWFAIGQTGPFASTASAGDDGSPPQIDDYVGDELAATGMHALDPVDLFNLMVLPRDEDLGEQGMHDLIAPASVYCASRRAMLLADAPASWTDTTTGRPKAGASDVDALRQGAVAENAAVYYPRLRQRVGTKVRTVGATGAIAGVMARTDVNRGVWKAPAGEEADVRNVADLSVHVTDREQGILNLAGGNVIRIFPSGIVVWGARTLKGSDVLTSEWKYIPIRRFALFLEETLFRGTKWVVFEPNDEPLWANIRKNIRAFMLGLFRQGAFEGATPDQAFYVKCDGETTTANDRNLGIVNIEVGFAPLKPAEFVVIRIQQIPPDVA